MVDLIDAVEADPQVAAPEPSRPTRLARIKPSEWKPGEWREYAPLLLVAVAVGFGAWMLRAELHALPYPNDASAHASFARFAEQRIRHGHSPFDAWYPYLGLGGPQFLQYQALSHILTGFLSIIFGDSTFRYLSYLFVCTWPITVYVGARLLDLDPWEAGAAAFISPMLVNVVGYGFEWGSFVWIGSGMWSMLWALWLLPIAMGLAWRLAVSRGERFALATFVVGLICALHFVTGYLVLLSIGVFVLVRPPQILKRIGRGALMGLGGLAIFAFVFVPAISGLNYVLVDQFQKGTFWVNSYGPGKVYTWLIHGQIFDSGRRPVVSLCVALGALVCLWRSRRKESARMALGLMILALLLWSGHRVVGPVMDRLPGGSNLLLHRYIIAVHFAGLMLAAIGSVWAFRAVVKGAQYAIRFRYGKVAVAVIACGLAVLAAYPVVHDRIDYADNNDHFLYGQIASDSAVLPAVNSLIDLANERGGGRIYAGSLDRRAAAFGIDQIPLFELPIQRDADSLGFTGRIWSLGSNTETAFNENVQSSYDLFNVRYLLLGPGQAVPVGVTATQVKEIAGYSLWEVNTSGYLQVIDTTEPVGADNTNLLTNFAQYLASDQPAQSRHPLIAFDGKSTATPSSSVYDPYTGPPGTVDSSAYSLDNGYFEGTVTASRPAWVMLKESYAPHWTATVDGVPVETSMVAPCYVGVPIPAGTHTVAFQYKSQSGYPIYFAFGLLTLLGFIFGPTLWRRYRRRRAPESAPESAPASVTSA